MIQWGEGKESKQLKKQDTWPNLSFLIMRKYFKNLKMILKTDRKNDLGIGNRFRCLKRLAGVLSWR